MVLNAIPGILTFIFVLLHPYSFSSYRHLYHNNKNLQNILFSVFFLTVFLLSSTCSSFFCYGFFIFASILGSSASLHIYFVSNFPLIFLYGSFILRVFFFFLYIFSLFSSTGSTGSSINSFCFLLHVFYSICYIFVFLVQFLVMFLFPDICCVGKGLAAI